MAALNYSSLSPIRFETVSAVTATPSSSLGDRLFFAGEEYVYCYNAGGATITKGLGVKFITGASGYSIAATSVTDTYNPLVGVCKHADIAAASYGWIMSKGFVNVSVVSDTTGDYQMLALGAAGKFIQASGTTTLGTATVVGLAMNANTAAGGAVYAFIKAGV